LGVQRIIKKLWILLVLSFIVFMFVYFVYSIYEIMIGKYNFRHIFYDNSLFVVALDMGLRILDILSSKKKKVIQSIIIMITSIDIIFLTVWTFDQIFIQKNGKIDYLFFFLSVALSLTIVSTPLFNSLEHRKKGDL